MADDITIPTTGTGTATPVVATDDVAGVHFQKVKPDVGASGASIPVGGFLETGSGAVGAIAVGGGTPHDSVDSGRPMKIGGKVSDTPASVVDGDRVDAWFDDVGRLAVWAADMSAGVDGETNNHAQLQTREGGGTATHQLMTRLSLFNGTDWDRIRSIAAMSDAPNVTTGILAAGVGPGFDRKENPANLGTATNSAITNIVNGADNFTYHIGTGTTGSFVFEVSADDTAWIAADILDTQADLWLAGNITPVNGKTYFVRTNGYRQVRIRTSATLGATVAVKTTASHNIPGPHRVNLIAPGGLATAQTNISSTAATLVAARITRKTITIINYQLEAVFIGPATVTTANGVRVDPGASFTLETTALVQGITAAATVDSAQKCHVLEVYY